MRTFVAGAAVLLVGCTSGGDGAPPNGPPPSSTVTPTVTTGPVVLASNQNAPATIAIDDTHIYWVNAHTLGGVFRMPKAGGAPTTLYEGAMGATRSLALDTTSLYFPTADAILAIPPAGGPSRVVASARAQRIAVANGSIYWLERASDPRSRPTAKRVPTAGGAPTTIALPDDLPLADGANWAVAAVDAVYFSIIPGGGVIKIPLDGSAPAWLKVPEARMMSTDADNIYFGAPDTIDVLPKSGCCVTHLAPAQSPGGIAVDDSFVYFGDSMVPDGRLLKMPRSGGAVTVLAEHQNGPGTIAIDATNIYWNSVNEGTIKRMAK